MSLYNGYFAEVLWLDPTGYGVHDVAPDGHKFDDDAASVIAVEEDTNYDPSNDKQYQKSKKFFDALIDLQSKDCPTLSIKYVTDESTKNEGVIVAEHAKDKECAISIYMGHGISSTYEYKDIEKVIEKNKIPNKGCKRSMFGVVGCHAGNYNDSAFPKENVLPGAPKNRNKISGDKARAQLLALLGNLDKKFKDMCKCCNGKVKLTIYFGSIDKNPKSKHTKHPKLK